MFNEVMNDPLDPIHTSIPLNPKSGTATMSIFGNRNLMSKYFSKNGSDAAVS